MMSGQLSAEEPLSTVDDPSAPSGVGFGDGGDALIADIGPSPISPRQTIPKDDEPNDSEIRFMGVHDAEDYEPLVDIDEIPDLLMRDGRDSTSSSGLRSGNTSEARRRSPPRLPPDPPEPPRASATDAPSAPEFLMLSELKDLLPQAPHDPPSAYAYRHGISASYTSEIEEWFGLEDDGELVLQAQASFERRWYSGPNKASGDAKSEPPTFWSTRTPATMRANFIQSAGHAVEGSRGPRRYDALLCLLNIALGDWSDTIERQLASDNTYDTEGSSNPMHFDGVGEMPKMRIFRITNLHRLRMIEGAELLSTYDAIPVIYDVLREVAAAKPDTDDRSKGKVEDREESGSSGNASDTLEVVLLILYLLVEAGRELRRRGMDTSIKSEIAALEPDYLPYFVKMLAKLRWSDSSDLPLSKVSNSRELLRSMR